tara:strand:+ start:722 stop:1036 length:315 start_codon:yes stop_codon:yes gene_type:complete
MQKTINLNETKIKVEFNTLVTSKNIETVSGKVLRTNNDGSTMNEVMTTTYDISLDGVVYEVSDKTSHKQNKRVRDLLDSSYSFVFQNREFKTEKKMIEYILTNN